MRAVVIVLLVLLSVADVRSTDWLVGPGRTYPSPSSVSGLVKNGDTVSIDAGVYTSDVARWSSHRLHLRGVGGNAILASQGSVYGGKAIWVITGDSTVVENISFTDARCADRNGAGIRLEGHGLVVRSCVFDANENGILVGAIRPCSILIEYCEFRRNGYGDGYSHNLYIGAIDTLIFRYNYSHHCKVGHELKSRADVNYVLCNRIATEADGTSSRLVDIPNGGYAVIAGNDLMQGTQTSNSNMIGYGLEGLRPGISHTFFIAHNTFVSTRFTALFTSYSDGTEEVGLWNNLVFGTGVLAPNVGTVPVHSKGNILADFPGMNLVDAQGTDFRLTAVSAARNSAVWDMASLPDANLAPSWEYVHPRSRTLRCVDSQSDVGAHEYCITSSMADASSSLTPDAIASIEWTRDILPFPSHQSFVRVWNACGELCLRDENTSSIDLSAQPLGVYLVETPTRKLRVLVVR